ncbi:MAG: hypothetical protein OXI03_01560, partial [Chloroflexota bacterium]|nr:hypothetical protein [Chloroflexota bacterium]
MSDAYLPGDRCDRTAELLEAHALDALDGDDMAIVGAHLDDGCPDCEAELAALRDVAGRIALTVPLRDPGRGLKSRVLREVEVGGRVEAPRLVPTPLRPPGRLAALAAPWRPARFASMAASAAVVAVVLLVGWNVVLQGDVSGLDDENEALLATVRTVEEQQAQAQQALADAHEQAADSSSAERSLAT